MRIEALGPTGDAICDCGDGDGVRQRIIQECERLRDLLLRKNRLYGNSIFDPVRVFAKDVNVEDQIRVRLDDKLSRILRGGVSLRDADEALDDVLTDIAGYVILWLVYRRMDGKGV